MSLKSHGKTVQDKTRSKSTTLEDMGTQENPSTPKPPRLETKKRRAEEQKSRREKRDNNTKALFPRDETTVGLIEVPGALAQQAQGSWRNKCN
jgi:hypothetical protein